MLYPPRMDARRWIARARVVVGLALWCTACDPTSATLTVRVQTGFRAGRDFTAVQTDVLPGSVRCEPPSSPGSDARPAFPPRRPHSRVGAFAGAGVPGLVPAWNTARVPLFPGAGTPVAHRCVVTSLSNERVVRVALTVDCLGVMCPAPAGSPQFDQCLNGRCVTDECNPDDPSTLEQCCDRSALGALCDSDETVCETGDDCAQTLMCSSPPSCEGGACIEPVEDLCADGEYCDARANVCTEVGAPPPDAGASDAGMDTGASDAGGLDAPTGDPDAFAAPDVFVLPDPDAWAADAFVPVGADAPFPDAFVLPDAFVAPDAFVVPDAFRAPDAFVQPDAFVAPDAFVSGGPEGSCTDAADGDTDGLIDCEDMDCSAHPDCAGVNCMVSTIMLNPEAAGLPVATGGPVLWWRSDTNTATRPFGLCGWVDGIRALTLRPTSRGRAPLLVPLTGGGSAIGLAPGDALTAQDGSALSAIHARTIIVLARHVSGGFTHAFVTGATNRPGIVTGLRHGASQYAYESGGVIGLASGGFASSFAHEYLALPMNHDPTRAELRIDGSVRTLMDPMEAFLPYSPNRQWVGSPTSSGTLHVLEIIVYDRRLDATDRGMVEAYANSRLLAAGM